MSDQGAPAPNQPRIRDLPSTERPRERLRDYGADSLGAVELLAILLRTGSKNENVIALATRLLSDRGGLAGLARTDFRDLRRVHGMGEAKAAQVLAALALAGKLAALDPEKPTVIRSAKDVADMLTPEMAFLPQESLRVVRLNVRNRVMGVSKLYTGNVSSAIVRAAEVFADAVRDGCTSIIIVHNHPSGDPTPSSDDVQVTKQMVEAGRALDIAVLDHVVVAQGGYVSLKERGLGFK